MVGHRDRLVDAGEAGTRRFLRQVADGYSGRLGAESRRRIIREGARQVSRETASPWFSQVWGFGPTFPKLAAAAVVLMVLALPLIQENVQTPTSLSPLERTPVRDLQVSLQGEQVVLSWKDGDLPRRVVRATTREELVRVSHLPGEMVAGQRWVEGRGGGKSGDPDIVFYMVD